MPVFVHVERLPIKTFTTVDGLRRDIVTRVRKDSRGFLWFCTPEGISRFDGVGMTNFGAADGLPGRFINDFLETKSGAVYVATSKGLARLNPHGIRGSKDNPLFTLLLPDNVTAQRVETLFEDSRNQVWVGTNNGLYKLIECDGRQPVLEVVQLAEPQIEGPGILEIMEDRNGALWMGSTRGLLRLHPGGRTEQFTVENGLIISLLEDTHGRIWAGSREHGLALLKPEPDARGLIVERIFTKQDGLPAEWIPDLLQSSDGKMWVATVSGLCLWQGESGAASVCKTYREENGLCDLDIWSITEDKDGNLWAGTACGAKKIVRYGFTSYTEEDGLGNVIIQSIFENRDGELLVTSNAKNHRISRFDGDKFSTVRPRLSENVTYMGWGWQQKDWQDSTGAWWVPTGEGLFRTPPTAFENLANVTAQKIKIREKIGEIFRLFEDSRGDVWIATLGLAFELWRWERATGVWHDYTTQVALPADRLVSAFVEDQSGNVWIGTGSDDSKGYYEGRLARYRDGKFRVFTDAEGAPRGWVRDLFVDSLGRLWIASTEDGLLRLDNPDTDRLDFVRYTPAGGLTSNATTCVTEDEFGRIYVGTWRGIDRLNPDTGQIETFTTADGLPANFIDTAYRDRKNNLWFTTMKGLVRFEPEPKPKRQPPAILIMGLRVGGESQAISILGETEIPQLDLNSEQRQISIDFLGLGTNLGEKLKYEYRFSGSDWTPTAERSVNFANLAAGKYHFEVRVVTADRIYSNASATVSFRIATPLWQRWWFLLLASLVVVGLIYLLYRYRLRQLLEIERTRTRIATDLHDDIGADLSKISLLSEILKISLANGNTESNRMLTTIADVSRASVDAMRDIVWAINPKRDSVLEMTRKMRGHAEEIFVPHNVAVKFNAPEEGSRMKLSMDVRRELFLTFKEAVNNAARHSGCQQVEINFAVSHGEISLEIKDDGCGFNFSQDFDGNGLENMKARSAKIGGRLAIESADGCGTIIKLRIAQ